MGSPYQNVKNYYWIIGISFEFRWITFEIGITLMCPLIKTQKIRERAIRRNVFAFQCKCAWCLWQRQLVGLTMPCQKFIMPTPWHTQYNIQAISNSKHNTIYIWNFLFSAIFSAKFKVRWLIHHSSLGTPIHTYTQLCSVIFRWCLDVWNYKSECVLCQCSWLCECVGLCC